MVTLATPGSTAGTDPAAHRLRCTQGGRRVRCYLPPCIKKYQQCHLYYKQEIIKDQVHFLVELHSEHQYYHSLTVQHEQVENDQSKIQLSTKQLTLAFR